MARPILHHRTREFSQLLHATRGNLQRIFKSENDVVILSSSGTGAMEAAVGNLLGPEDRALAVVAGKFGERWVEICHAFDVPVVLLSKEYGTAAGADEIAAVLRSQPSIGALLIQGCETSTGTRHDLEAISRRLRREFPSVLTVVDAITALGSQPVETERWSLDVVIGGSQKSFSISPGLSFLSLSARAVERLASHRSGHYYFDLWREIQAQRRGQTAFTPAVSLVEALYESTQAILDQGLEEVLSEVDLLARSARAGLQALGFRLLSSSPANAVTAVFPPPGLSAPRLVEKLEERFDLKVAGGQGPLKGKIIRIAHLGYFDILDLFSFLSALELCLLEMGSKAERGAGLKAALEIASNSTVGGADLASSPQPG